MSIAPSFLLKYVLLKLLEYLLLNHLLLVIWKKNVVEFSDYFILNISSSLPSAEGSCSGFEPKISNSTTTFKADLLSFRLD